MANNRLGEVPSLPCCFYIEKYIPIGETSLGTKKDNPKTKRLLQMPCPEKRVPLVLTHFPMTHTTVDHDSIGTYMYARMHTYTYFTCRSVEGGNPLYREKIIRSVHKLATHTHEYTHHR